MVANKERTSVPEAKFQRKKDWNMYMMVNCMCPFNWASGKAVEPSVSLSTLFQSWLHLIMMSKKTELWPRGQNTTMTNTLHDLPTHIFATQLLCAGGKVLISSLGLCDMSVHHREFQQWQGRIEYMSHQLPTFLRTSQLETKSEPAS